MTVIIEPSKTKNAYDPAKQTKTSIEKTASARSVGLGADKSNQIEKLSEQVKEAQIQSDLAQYLMFELNREIYALDILTVREILDIPPITRVPRVPEYILGVINLRGSVVPVIDLNSRLGFNKLDNYTKETCIIIVEKEEKGELRRPFGLVVDAVQEVIVFGAEQISEVSRVGISMNTDFIEGVGNHQDNFVLIMNLNRILQIVTESRSDNIERIILDKGSNQVA